MATFNLCIVSPQGKVFEGPAESVVAPGSEGELGVLAHHAPMIAFLKVGMTTVAASGEKKIFVTGQGVIEVELNEVNLLVDHAEKVDSAEKAHELIAAETTKRKG